jgi:maleate cis-trans isomerase
VTFCSAIRKASKAEPRYLIAVANGQTIRIRIRNAIRSLADSGVEAIVQAGTDLAVIDIADEAERWLGIPVIAVNAASYWPRSAE